jgi:alanyl aminopeptidase
MRMIRLSLYLSLALASAALGGCGAKNKKTASPVDHAPPLARATHDIRVSDPIVRPMSYAVSLGLDPSASTFGGSVVINGQVTRSARDFYLNGRNLTIASASIEVGGQSMPLTVTPEGEDWLHFEAAAPLPVGPAVVRVSYSGQVDDKSSFGVFRQESAGDWYLYTQFESRGARRAFPCLDQPDSKVPWTLRIEVPSDQVALANTPEMERTPGSEGHTVYSFAPSKPLPSYLVAFAVGPFDIVDIGKTRNETPVRVVTPRGRGGEASYVVESTLDLIEILEDYLGSAYPYAKLDLLAVPNTGTFGAMENAGLITFTESLLLSKDNPLGHKQAYASVGAHEMAHQWFGDLVTCRWWDDLWLNESFATWMSAKVVASYKPEWGADASWIQRRAGAMSADRLASARVIRQPIEKEGDIGAAFDGITYAKGASVLTMMENWLGAEQFQNAIQHYLGNNQWTAASAETFLTAMDQATDGKVSAPFSSFLTQPGTPLIRFELECQEGAAPKVVMQQERYAPLGSNANTAEVYRVPVCVRYPGEGGEERQCTLLEEARGELTLDKATSCPGYLVPNDGATGYYRSLLSEPLFAALSREAPLSIPERLGLADDARALTFAGHMSLDAMLALVPPMAKDKDPRVVAAAASLARLGRVVRDEDRARYGAWLSRLFGRKARSLGWRPSRNETAITKDLRSDLLSLLIFEAGDKSLRRQGERLATKWISNPGSVDPDLAGLALEVGARYGDATRIDSYLQFLGSTADRSRRRLLFHALAEVEDPAQVDRALGLLLDETIDVRESSAVLNGLASKRTTAARAFQFVQSNVDALIERYGEEMQVRLGRAAAAQCDDATKDAAIAFLTERIAAMKGGEKAAAQGVERIQLCVAARNALSLPATLPRK